MRDDFFEKLLEKYFEGELKGEDHRDFENLLLESSERREEFWAEAKIRRALIDVCEQESGARIEVTREWPTAKVLAIAAGITVLAGLAWLWIPETPNGEVIQTQQDPIDKKALDPIGFSVAVVKEVVGLENDFQRGGVMAPGAYKIGEGDLVLDFYSGARLRISGPARFELISEMAMNLMGGALEADVPESASGFMVNLPSGRVIDLGTRFALKLEEEGDGHLIVREGEVEFHGSEGSRLLKESERVRILKDGSLEEEVKRSGVNGYEQWLAASSSLAGDPSLLLYFRFQDGLQKGRFLPNEGTHENAPLEGTVVGSDWVAGRWPEKGALSFYDEADRIRVDVDGEYDQVTWMAWVQVHDLGKTYAGLVLSEYEIEGSAHWQLGKNGGFLFGIKPDQLPVNWRYHRAFGDPFLNPGMPQWRFLVTTYDSEKRTVNHYVDGEIWHKETIPESIRIRFGKATIGNSPPMPRLTRDGKLLDWHLRQLGGVIDELGIFSRVLSAEEIESLYQTGKP
ncbi:LamG-like jellyroll fold domain-containing protein [Verrucomicrobiaceae bacterium 227]